MPAPIVDVTPRNLPRATQSGGFLSGLIPQLDLLLRERQSRQATSTEQALRREELQATRDFQAQLLGTRGEQSLEQIGARGDVESGLVEQRTQDAIERDALSFGRDQPNVERRLGVQEGNLAVSEGNLALREEIGPAELAIAQQRADTEAERVAGLNAAAGRGGGSRSPLAGAAVQILDRATEGERPTEEQLRGAIAFSQGDPESAQMLLGAPGGVQAGGTTRTPPGGEPVEVSGAFQQVSQEEVNVLNSRPAESHVATLRQIADPKLQQEYLSLLNPELAAQVVEQLR